MMGGTKRLVVDLPASLKDSLESTAKKKGETMTSVVEQLVKKWVEKNAR